MEVEPEVSHVETGGVNPVDIVDIDEAVDTFMGDKETVQQLLTILVDKTAQAINEITTEIEEPNLEAVRASAHAVKGSSMNLSVIRLGHSAAELEDAAIVDGCGRMGLIFKIFIPLAAPGLVAAGAIAFMLSWADFLFAYILTSTINAKTITVTTAGLEATMQSNWALVTASGVLAALPPIIGLLIFQNWIKKGLAGGIKG